MGMRAVDNNRLRQGNDYGVMVSFSAKMWMVAVVILTLSGGRAAASEQNQVPEEQPSMEMLEFLGDWQTREGVWFDPTVKEQKQEPTQEQSHD
jgi:hypothetical protein